MRCPAQSATGLHRSSLPAADHAQQALTARRQDQRSQFSVLLVSTARREALHLPLVRLALKTLLPEDQSCHLVYSVMLDTTVNFQDKHKSRDLAKLASCAVEEHQQQRRGLPYTN